MGKMLLKLSDFFAGHPVDRFNKAVVKAINDAPTESDLTAIQQQVGTLSSSVSSASADIEALQGNVTTLNSNKVSRLTVVGSDPVVDEGIDGYPGDIKKSTSPAEGNGDLFICISHGEDSSTFECINKPAVEITSTDPTESTVGRVGQLLFNSTTNKLWLCTLVSDVVYTWVSFTKDV